MIIAGYAVVFHGYPRFTKDFDIYFELTDENIGKSHLMKNKLATNRLRDKADVEEML